MNSTISVFELFNNSVFYIPQYQRAYSWEESPQLDAFIEDLRQQAIAQKQQHGVTDTEYKKKYFLGTLLLHEIGQNPSRFDIVDGQQRLTTTVIFIATGLSVLTEKKKIEKGFSNPLRRAFIFNDDDETQRFHTIPEDDPVFASSVLGLGNTTIESSDSPSIRKLLSARDYFEKTVKIDEWPVLLDVLKTAQVITYIVDNPSDATQIFELQNDRGKRLTDLEALKSYLMHAIYLSSKNPTDPLNQVQTLFAKIYRLIEEISKHEQAPESEDSILSYHCIGNLDWNSDEWRDPKPLVKSLLAKIPHGEKAQWVLDFSQSVLTSFSSVLDILKCLDKHPELSDLFVLKRMASFWPLLIKIWGMDSDANKSRARKVCRLLEVFSFKGYSIAGVRSDTGASHLRTWTKSFAGDFDDLCGKCYSLSSWWNIQARFENYLDSPSFYHFNKADVRYFYWRYENSLRSRKGQHQPLLTWRDFLSLESKKKFNIEHISPQTSVINDSLVVWADGGEEEKFEDVALHRMGNLVLDTTSLNSAKQDGVLADKIKQSEYRSSLLSTGELKKWARTDSSGNYIWTLDSIKDRHEYLTKFAIEQWDAGQYYSGPMLSQESQDGELEGNSE